MANITIQFKRGTKEKLEQRLVPGDLGVPAKGEPIWETDTNKLKIGDGITSYINLDYFGGDVDDHLVLEGYYSLEDDKFYDKPLDDPDKQRLPEWSSKLYKDLDTGNSYYYKSLTVGKHFKVLNINVNLYNSSGQNVDGAMTQKAVTDAINNINFGVDTSDTECLTLNKPW